MPNFKWLRKDVAIFVLLTALAIIFWNKALFNFFAQDDFILIGHFSQNSFGQNLANVFGMPSVTHWRPVHNLYFLISGILFGKNYIGYHLVTFAIQILSSFFIYLVTAKILKSRQAALAASVFYLVSPIHFVSLFWISGNATAIGFLFLIAAFYFYIAKRFLVAVSLFIASIFASEAMILGALIFLAWNTLFEKPSVFKMSNLVILLIGLFSGLLQLTLFKPTAAVDAYRIELSLSVVSALKYYLLRIPGFIEGAGLNLISAALIIWWGMMAVIFTKNFLNGESRKFYVFAVLVFAIGFFPFVLIPNHLSGHYMNISLWGLATFVGLTLTTHTKKYILTALMVVIVAINFLGVSILERSSWVIKRSDLARTYLQKIETENQPAGSTIVFGDNPRSTSLEAYYALGTGKAIKFWFPGKNYKTCFTAFDNCLK